MLSRITNFFGVLVNRFPTYMANRVIFDIGWVVDKSMCLHHEGSMIRQAFC